ncbi:MAG: YraN family protein [Anaerolineae bacterium]
MTTAKVGLGRRGEHLAAQALTAAGYTLIDRNWRCPVGEVDLVVRRGADLYFVEVRTRRSTATPAPEESLIRRKVARMETVARMYLGTHTTATSTWHLSFVAVTMDRGGRLRRITFYPDLEGEPEDLLINR